MDNQFRRIEDLAAKVDPITAKLQITAQGKPGDSGACNVYTVYGYRVGENPLYTSNTSATGQSFYFQSDEVGRKGPDGITMEAMLLMLADRLNSLNEGPKADKYYAAALSGAVHALGALKARSDAAVAAATQPLAQAA